MRHQLKMLLVLGALASAQLATAQDEGAPVPVEKAAYHVPVFSNQFLSVLRVNIPSQRSAGYHVHSRDQISILVEEADQTAQVSANSRRRRAAIPAAT